MVDVQPDRHKVSEEILSRFSFCFRPVTQKIAQHLNVRLIQEDQYGMIWIACLRMVILKHILIGQVRISLRSSDDNFILDERVLELIVRGLKIGVQKIIIKRSCRICDGSFEVRFFDNLSFEPPIVKKLAEKTV